MISFDDFACRQICFPKYFTSVILLRRRAATGLSLGRFVVFVFISFLQLIRLDFQLLIRVVVRLSSRQIPVRECLRLSTRKQTAVGPRRWSYQSVS